MNGFTKFDPGAFLEKQSEECAPAKVANPANSGPKVHSGLATLAALAAPSLHSDELWRRRFTARAFQWFVGTRTWKEAAHLAWGDMQNEWHALHGKRWPTWQCAGCDMPLSGQASIDLPDGNRVHLKDITCLLNFGRRWRDAADQALVGHGLDLPVTPADFQ